MGKAKQLYVVWTKHKRTGLAGAVIVKGKRTANKKLKSFKKKYVPMGYNVYKRKYE
jgi:hypothetical protein